MQHVSDLEPGKLRKAASDGAQAAVWIWFLVMLLVLIVAGAVWGLGHRLSVRAPELSPALPTLPGKMPHPERP